MAKRFTDTEKWKDDWYLSLCNDYRIVWQWLLDNCNHAGICKPSVNLLNMMCNTKLSESELFEIFKDRLINFNTFWFIPKFVKFQYVSLDSKKPAVISVIKELKINNLLNYVSELFNNDYETITEPLHNDYVIIKDKDKDKDKVKDKDKDIVDLPFKNSEFESAWNDWKEYKQSQHKFKFKSKKSEQTALNQLSELSKNSSDIAIKIINQSIANGWKGFFELKNLNNGNNKKQTGVEQLLAKAKLDFQTYTGGKPDCRC